LAFAHAEGVNSLIWTILAAGATGRGRRERVGQRAVVQDPLFVVMEHAAVEVVHVKPGGGGNRSKMENDPVIV